MNNVFLTGALQEILYLDPPSFLTNLPLLFDKPPKVPKKTLPGPKKMTDMTQKKSLALKYIEPPFFAKKRVQFGIVWPGQLHF